MECTSDLNHALTRQQKISSSSAAEIRPNPYSVGLFNNLAAPQLPSSIGVILSRWPRNSYRAKKSHAFILNGLRTARCLH
jgi:hypothetical protein